MQTGINFDAIFAGLLARVGLDSGHGTEVPAYIFTKTGFETCFRKTITTMVVIVI